MDNSPFIMGFDPRTVKHLGLQMYSTLPPALAEVISNSYDADATNVVVTLTERNGIPTEIRVEDDGMGLTSDEINTKFLVIGRDRRADDGDKPSPKYKRLPTGKKGLGKLALFGVANTITVRTTKDRLQNEFILDWDDLLVSEGSYKPRATIVDAKTDENDGTVITLKGLKRKSRFESESLADSLSKIFIFESNFNLVVESPNGAKIAVDNDRKYRQFDKEFEWDVESPLLVPEDSDYFGGLQGRLYTSTKPIRPSTELRGITLFSRGKLVNAPEYFSSSASSHFYQYLTGWITIDFIDLIQEDVIATNRRSLAWEHPDMKKLRALLSSMVSKVNTDWRRRRKEKKEEEIEDATGIDREKWLNSMPGDVRINASRILDTLGGEDALEKIAPVVEALYEIVPEYPLLHWRHLHLDIKNRVKSFYENKQYGIAASQGVQIYAERIRSMTGRTEDGRDLVNRIFGSPPFSPAPEIQLNDLTTDSLRNIQEGQGHLSRGVVTGFRNPIFHEPIDTVVPAVFSELDCLNILSLVSYLMTRLDNATVNPSPSST